MISHLPSLCRALFVVTSPEVLHAGIPTPLAVTFLANFPGKVTAELAQGNTKVAQTEDFQEGDTVIRVEGQFAFNFLTFRRANIILLFKVQPRSLCFLL